jgi:regulator of PEP synthase PpsR (kinase-PPPase family)
MTSAESRKTSKTPPVFIVSGGNGASGRHLVDTVLVQYPDLNVPVVMKTNVRRAEQVKDIISEAAATQALIVHSMVAGELRAHIVRLAEEKGVLALDVMGPLFHYLTAFSGHEPLGKPGLYRILHQGYYDRVAAIEFAMTHDDGQRQDELHLAEVVLLGVSRSGKTPLSMYLAVLGWRVANLPIVPQVPLPENMAQVDSRKIFGLDIDYELLLKHRRFRQEQFGFLASTAYTKANRVIEEVEAARKIFRRYRARVIDVTDKAIETSAAEILEYLEPRTDLERQ